MVNLIDISYFEESPYLIPIGDMLPEQSLTDQVGKRQREFLIAVLGFQEYYNLENDNGGNLPITQKWVDFIDGVVYQKDNYNIDYKGIREALQRYVYFWYVRNNLTQMTEAGGVELQFENSIRKSGNQNAVDAYNEMTSLIGSEANYEPTIFNYLNDHDFDAIVTEFEHVNAIL